MVVSTRFKPIEIRALLRTDPVLSPEGRSKLLASYAQQQFALVDAENTEIAGRKLDSTVYVDGVANANPSSVRPDGKIIYEWDVSSDLVSWCFEQVVKASPVKTGKYQKSHRLYADGNEIDPNGVIPSADEYVITSIVPYARKIEGTGGKVPQSRQAVDGVYQAVAVLAKARFGNVAKIDFTYRQPLDPGSALHAWAAGHAAKRDGAARQRRQYNRDTRQPAIIIKLR